jgi:starch synthase
MVEKYPDLIGFEMGYNEPLAHQIQAGADMLLMPSRYEPCGLAQMIAMRYGCVPVVRATGGLKDTVKAGKTGFLFDEPSPDTLKEAITTAITIFKNKVRWKQYQRNCMLEDFSWTRSAYQYAIIYRSLMESG